MQKAEVRLKLRATGTPVEMQVEGLSRVLRVYMQFPIGIALPGGRMAIAFDLTRSSARRLRDWLNRWLAGGEKPDGRRRMKKAEGRRQKAEVRMQKSEGRSQKAEG
jgi:hypothetical protein